MNCKKTGEITEAHFERMQIGKRIRDDRVGRLVTLREEAKRLDVGVAEWSRIEHGREPETLEGQAALATRIQEVGL